MNEKQIKTRRFYLMLPLLVLPFITIAFGLMGGGSAASGVSVRKNGLNTALPDAHNGKDSGRDKMSFYEMANAESAKRNEQLRNDPNFKAKPNEPVEEVIEEREISQSRVRAIRERIKIPDDRQSDVTAVQNYLPQRPVQSTRQEVDPDLEAINQTIEKLAALQNPVKAAEKVTAEVRKEILFVNASTDNDETYFGKKVSRVESKEFLNDNGSNKKPAVSFAAFAPTEQVLQTGSVLKLQLRQSITIAGVIIPSGTSLHGVVTIENERLFVQISSIQFAGNIYPVALSVFDMDGIEGIRVPGSVSRDVIKSTAEQSLQSVNVLSLDPSIKTQAVTAGIGAAKNLLSRKVKTVRATITAGYNVLLRDNKAN
jgi:conjugative transposon TraM protein